ncbi:VWA domain-containing protein [Actinacidiphila yeochonensis]|uniref:VWA domain-containing protein n=1 Tax=Actinacidiphila yeochonensis TaxID=89050 RepID=UPI00068DCA9B|nr:VWA domain-containing protein [Actinacidiphila yeochonensis]
MGLTGAAGAAERPDLAEVLVVDCSGSMDHPEEKFRQARNAAVAALRALPDGTPFAVVKGNQRAEAIYPPSGRMRPASEETRRAAEAAVRRLEAAGGTCLGDWLDLAGRLLDAEGAPVPHVLMLTDGRNEHDRLNPLRGVLDTWEGRFVCDAWGIGDGWEAQVLRDAVERLHGRADFVRREDELPSAYQDLIARLLTRTVPEVELRVTPLGSTAVRYLRQVYPNDLRLAGVGADGGLRYATRAWGDETRRYQLCLSVAPDGLPPGEDLQVAMVAAAVPGAPPGTPVPEAGCLVQWTDDPVRADTENSANRERAHVERHRHYGRTVARAAEEYRQGDRRAAERLLGEAVRTAYELAAADPDAGRYLAELAWLVEVADPAAGEVHLREGDLRIFFEHVITASTHTTFGPAPGAGGGVPWPGDPSRPLVLTACPGCPRHIPAGSRFCPHCGHRFDGEAS